MAPMRFRNNRASFMVALNKGAFTVASFLPVVSAKELSNIWSSYSPARLPRSWCIGRTAWTTRLRPSSGRVTALYAGHEDFLLLLRGKKGRAAFWTKLQKLVSHNGGCFANLSFI